jgi:hypothetical protein
MGGRSKLRRIERQVPSVYVGYPTDSQLTDRDRSSTASCIFDFNIGIYWLGRPS